GDGDASWNSRRRLLLARNRCGGEIIGGTRPTLLGDCGGRGADDSGRLRPLVHVECQQVCCDERCHHVSSASGAAPSCWLRCLLFCPRCASACGAISGVTVTVSSRASAGVGRPVPRRLAAAAPYATARARATCGSSPSVRASR